jgi:hypothetical protein
MSPKWMHKPEFPAGFNGGTETPVFFQRVLYDSIRINFKCPIVDKNLSQSSYLTILIKSSANTKHNASEQRKTGCHR